MLHVSTLQAVASPTASLTFAAFPSWAFAHGMFLAPICLLSATAWRLHALARAAQREQVRERRMREELQAYTALDLSPDPGFGTDTLGATRALARRVCRTIAGKSVFSRVSLLLRDPEGRLVLMGSVGADDLTTAALQDWGERIVQDERNGRGLPLASPGTADPSFSISLGEWRRFDPEVASWTLAGRKERRRCRRGMVTPIRTRGGRILGALAVCADGARLDGTRAEVASDAWNSGRPASLGRALAPLEALAARLASALEATAFAERLLRAEKLAGLGQLAGGVAHALNNPLTAVLGFADLIAESATEAHIRQDAATILDEANRMKATVQRLVEISQPPRLPDRAVEVSTLLVAVANDCESSLTELAIKLELKGLDVPGATMLGSSERLRGLFEHLLNNAAQSITSFRSTSGREEEDHTIRIMHRNDGGVIRLVVSDTGTGFAEPQRAFDPFYTTRGPEQGAGMGLSICYGVVREHGGEISASNLHPHGASVVIEFPVRSTSGSESILKEEEETMPIAPQASYMGRGEAHAGFANWVR